MSDHLDRLISNLTQLVPYICGKMDTVRCPETWIVTEIYGAFYDTMCEIRANVPDIGGPDYLAYQAQCLDVEGRLIDEIAKRDRVLTHNSALAHSTAYRILFETGFTRELSGRQFAHIKPAQ